MYALYPARRWPVEKTRKSQHATTVLITTFPWMMVRLRSDTHQYPKSPRMGKIPAIWLPHIPRDLHVTGTVSLMCQHLLSRPSAASELRRESQTVFWMLIRISLVHSQIMPYIRQNEHAILMQNSKGRTAIMCETGIIALDLVKTLMLELWVVRRDLKAWLFRAAFLVATAHILKPASAGLQYLVSRPLSCAHGLRSSTVEGTYDS